MIYEQLNIYPYVVNSGTLSYTDYRSSRGYYEQTTGGTAIFWLQDSAGSTAGTNIYSVDYRRGKITFNNTTNGTVYYLNGSSYDMNAAAADTWRRKMAHVATSSFNFSTDNHSITRAQVYEHAKEMAEFFESKSGDAVP